METIILIITNLLLLGVVFYMIRKLRDRSEAKELHENLKSENEKFLDFLSENEMTFGEYEWLKQEKTDAINKWFAKLMHEDSIFYGWQWQDAKGLNSIILITKQHKKFLIKLEFEELNSLYVKRGIFLDQEFDSLIGALPGTYDDEELSFENWLSYANTIITSERNFKFLELVTMTANEYGSCKFNYSDLLEKDYEIVSKVEIEALVETLKVNYKFKSISTFFDDLNHQVVLTVEKSAREPQKVDADDTKPNEESIAKDNSEITNESNAKEIKSLPEEKLDKKTNNHHILDKTENLVFEEQNLVSRGLDQENQHTIDSEILSEVRATFEKIYDYKKDEKEGEKAYEIPS